jgi:hypothetical protein
MEIVHLGQGAGRPWTFLPVCWQALRVVPGDVGLRILCAANLARLGLRTLAMEELDALTGQAMEDAAAIDLRRACAQLPDDRLPAREMVEQCRRNLHRLSDERCSSAPALRESFDQWARRAGDDEWFRTLDGEVIRRGHAPHGNGELGGWVLFGDHKAAARRFAAEHLGAAGGASLYTVEGIHPPWLLEELFARTAESQLGWVGFQPRLALVQGDPLEFLDGLALADLGDVLAHPRVMWFVGPGAGERLLDDLRGRFEMQISGPVVPLLTIRQRVGAESQAGDSLSVPAIVEQAQREQAAEHQRLAREVRAIYGGRGLRWWAHRFADAAAGGPPLRMLVPTTRYSTYIQHSSRDLVEALGSAGFEAKLLIERDGHSRMSSLAYLRALRDLQPDAVMLINHFRHSLDGGGGWLPRELPFVTWIQDAMPHHFEAGLGERLGDLDFIVGHLHKEMFAAGGVGRERTVAFPVVVSATKFHDGPAAPELRARFECEVAFVSHHSEPPRPMHERLMREAGAGNAAVGRLLEDLYPEVVRIGEEPMKGVQRARLRGAVEEALRTATGQVQEHQVTALLYQYALPVAERALRHQTAHWAAAICRERGWRFHLYGRGWEDVKELGEFARGPAAHGDELRAIYQCASVHLHMSATALVHQRIMECALSGGLPVCRLTMEEVETICAAARKWAMAGSDAPEVEPEACEIGTQRLGLRIADTPELMRLTMLLQRLGLSAGGLKGHPAGADERMAFWWFDSAAEGSLRPEATPRERRADWVCGDLAELSFQTPDELAALVERAAGQSSWRSAMSASMAARVHQRLTHEAFIGRTLDLIGRSLAASEL